LGLYQGRAAPRIGDPASATGCLAPGRGDRGWRAAPITEERDIPDDDAVKSATALTKFIEESLEDDKAEDVTVIGLTGKTSIADFMIIASGRSQRHVAAIAEHMLERLKRRGVRPVSVEGRQRADWVLLDAGDVIIHLFRPEVRSFYNLEKMWAVPLPEHAAG